MNSFPPITQSRLHMEKRAMQCFSKPFIRGAWAAQHADEGAQSFEDYLEGWPRIGAMRGRRSDIRFEIDTKLTQQYSTIAKLCSGLVGSYFGFNTSKVADLHLDQFPHSAFRVDQVRVSYLASTIQSRLGCHDFATVGLVAADLCPNDEASFVFGEAHHQERWCVVSTSRYELGSLDAGSNELRRLFKVLTHEVGHLLGMPHCVMHSCNMNGANDRDELDAHPFDLCAECWSKVSWVMDYRVTERAESLGRFLDENRFPDDARCIREKAAHCTTENLARLSASRNCK